MVDCRSAFISNGSELPLHGGSKESIGDHCRIGVVTVSDRASEGAYQDKSGPAIVQVCPFTASVAMATRFHSTLS